MEEKQQNPEKYNLPLPPRKRHKPSYWQNYIANNLSEQESTMAQTQNPTFDFAFVMKPVKILKQTFEAFSNFRYNPGNEAVIQVADRGCEFIVSTFNVETGRDGFGYLGLKATGLEKFQCKEKFRKTFSLEGITKGFKSVDHKSENASVFVYVVEGSNKLSFDFGNRCLENIDLKPVDPAVEQIPARVSYGFEAVIRSSVLRAMAVKLQKQADAATCRPETVEVTLKPATVAICKGRNIIASSTVFQGQAYRISTEWQNWNSLKSASFTADKASVCLVTDPFTGIMVWFHLDEELGNLVCLHPAEFKSVPELPVLGYFRSLLGHFSTMQ